MSSSIAENCSFHSLPGIVPAARQTIVPVIEQVQLARDTFRVRFEAPELAQEVVPGQFFMIRAPGVNNPLLGRPFALFDTWLDPSGEPAGIDIVYLVVGKMTGLISSWASGDRAEIWGPLGNGFPLPSTKRLVIAAGGIGNTPFPAVVREALGLRRYGTRTIGKSLAAAEIVYCYGVRSAEYLAAVEEFHALGVNVQLATDDGSCGHHGFVTDLVTGALDRGSAAQTQVFCCGPEPMMHAVAKLTSQRQVACWLSLETPMACGFGACFSCVTRVRQSDGAWDYRRTCVEGPIFRADELDL